MTPKQKRFVARYLVCRNATKAALHAGYSPLGAPAAGFKLLSKPAIVAALREAGLKLDADRIHPLRRNAAGLNLRQQRFVDHYRVSRNAKDAARRAGYRAGHAAHAGSALLRYKPVIAALRAAGVTITYGKHPRDQIRKSRGSYARTSLTLRQQRFIAAYLVHGNATQAALAAGLSPRHAGTAGWQMLQRPLVAAAIEAARQQLIERTRIDAARVTAEYARIAFANIRDILDWGPDGSGLKLKRAISADDRAAVREISAHRAGNGKPARVHVKMHSKLKALDALAKHLGLFGQGPQAPAAPWPDKEQRAEVRRRLLRLARGEGEPAAATEKDSADKKKP